MCIQWINMEIHEYDIPFIEYKFADSWIWHVDTWIWHVIHWIYMTDFCTKLKFIFCAWSDFSKSGFHSHFCKTSATKRWFITSLDILHSFLKKIDVSWHITYKKCRYVQRGNNILSSHQSCMLHWCMAAKKNSYCKLKKISVFSCNSLNFMSYSWICTLWFSEFHIIFMNLQKTACPT